MYFHLHTPAYTYTHFQRELQEPNTRRRRPQKRNCAQTPHLVQLSFSLPFLLCRALSLVFYAFLSLLSLSTGLSDFQRVSVCVCVSLSRSPSLSRACSLSLPLSLSLSVSLSLCTVLKRCTRESSKLSPNRKKPTKAPRPYICSFFFIQ